MSRIRLIAISILLAVGLAVADSPTSVRAAADTMTVSSLSPSTVLPLAPSVATSFTVKLNIALSNSAQESVRLVGLEDGKGTPIALSSDVPVTGGSHIGTGAITVSASYTPGPAARWLAVQAVLGPAAQPLATLALQPYLVMSTTLRSKVTIFYSPGVSADLASKYAAAYDLTWQKVGDLLGSYKENSIAIFLAADADVYDQAFIAFGASPAVAAIFKTSSGAVSMAALNLIMVKLTSGENDVRVVTLGHEYTHNRFSALLAIGTGSWWLGEGMADTMGLLLAESVPAARCEADSLLMSRWLNALDGIRDGRYLPLNSIETPSQWTANRGDAAKNALQYAEGYTTAEYLKNRFGMSKLLQVAKQPKALGNLEAAVQQVMGVGMTQLEQDYLAYARQHLNEAPATIKITIRLDAAGTNAQTRIVFNVLYTSGTEGLGFQTARGLAPGDYAFEIAGNGTVRSTDSKAALTQFKANMTGFPRGRALVMVQDPTYRGQTGVAGANRYEQLAVLGAYGRAGLSYRRFQFPDTTTGTALGMVPQGIDNAPVGMGEPADSLDSAFEFPAGDCLGSWPDGNRIDAAVQTASNEGPQLGGPAHGSRLPTLGASLTWAIHPTATQYQLQIVPAKNDGPAINLIRNAETSFTIEPPEIGRGSYVMLPDMTYSWRMRVSDSPTSLGENDSGWGPWSNTKTFQTPIRDSSRLQTVSPLSRATTSASPQVLRWSNGDTDVFYYEIQVSPDSTFETDPSKATAAVWGNLVHGGVSALPNSWATPPLAPNTAYYWRVRPRVQGDGSPVAWSTSWSFKTGAS